MAAKISNCTGRDIGCSWGIVGQAMKELFMKFLIRLCWLLLIFASFPDGCAHADDAERMRNWPSWRGPLRTGVAPSANPPVEWNENKNIRWKTELPGKGHSSPVVWGDSIYVTTAIPYGPQLEPVPVTATGAHDNVDVTQRHRFAVICVNRDTGEIRWQKTVANLLPHEGGHNTGSLASASPVTNGRHVFAYFGSFGLFALDPSGEIQWRHSLPQLESKHAHGEGASVALHDDVLIVNCDHEKQSFIRAIDTATGQTRWEKPRDEVTSWSSPLVVVLDSVAQVVVAGTDRIRSYKLQTGDILWQCGGLSANVVATPVASEGILIAGSSYDTRAMMAVDLNKATGDITGSGHVLWTTTQRTPYVPSMLLVKDNVYFLRHYQNILSRRNIRTGTEAAGPFRLAGVRDIYSSPVAAAGRIYVTDLYGRTLVMTDADSPKQLALNQLDDEFAATAALVENEIILRGEKFLYNIAETAD